MNFRQRIFLTWLIVIVFVIPFPASAQQIPDPEAEFLRIRDRAFSGDIINAENDARRLVNAFPAYGDARVLLGRIMAWQKKYPGALAVLDSLLLTEPDNADALSAKNDIMLWMKASNPGTTNLRAGYSFDYFRQPYSRFWQILSTGAGHMFKWGNGYAGINTGYLISGEPSNVSSPDIQAEVEAYPKLSEKSYMYISAALSPGNYFPGYRAAFEIWRTLPAGWGLSAGLNYFFFDRSIFIAGSSVEKYAGKYWLSARGYLYFKDEGPTASGYFNARRYFNDTDYLQASISTGTAPDEPFDVQADLMRLSANAFRVTCNFQISPIVTLRATSGFSIEEYAESEKRNRFDGNITIVYSLKKKSEK